MPVPSLVHPRFAQRTGQGYVPGVDVWTLWRGQRDTTRRALWALIALSLVLHLPLTPLAGLVGWWRSLLNQDAPLPSEQLTGIPIELLEEEGLPTPPPEAPPEPATSEPAAPEKDPEQPKKPDLDAGVPDAGSKDAGPDDAGTDGGPVADAGPADAGLADPIAVKGALRKVIDTNAAVQLVIYNARIRKHPLGGRVGGLLGSIPQWRDFFGPAQINPVNDIEQMMIIGPQLRDSSEVLAALRLSVPDEQLKAAVEHIVRADRQGGRWVEDAGVPVAIATADRAERVFVLLGSGVIVVAPPKVQNDITGNAKAFVRKMRSADHPDAIVSAKIKTPVNALRGVFKVPKTIKFAKVVVLATDAEGAEVIIEAEDQDEATAAESAKYLDREVEVVARQGLIRAAQSVEFTSTGTRIDGRIVITKRNLLDILDAISIALLMQGISVPTP
jgi:hypothetical protein